MTEHTVSELLVVGEAAQALHITPGRVRQLIQHDQRRDLRERKLPSARKATAFEESELRADGRIKGVPYTGILVVARAEIEALRIAPRAVGRPPGRRGENV